VICSGWISARLERDPQGFRKLLRQPNFFPESKPAVELFHDFRQRKLSFGLIVDEYGGVTGLVTMEDLLECVFGEIVSPSDSEVVDQHLLSELPDGRRLIETSILLDDFNREFSVGIASAEVETLAGALLAAFGELPAAGAATVLCGLKFTVDNIEHNRITRVVVERLPISVEPQETECADTGSASPELLPATVPAAQEDVAAPRPNGGRQNV
jgi:putative hemolysin